MVVNSLFCIAPELPTIAKLSQILLFQDAEKPDPLCFVV